MRFLEQLGLHQGDKLSQPPADAGLSEIRPAAQTTDHSKVAPSAMRQYYGLIVRGIVVE